MARLAVLPLALLLLTVSALPVAADPPTPPSAPLDLAAEVGTTCIRLTWSAPASDGGDALLGYNVHRGAGAEPPAFYSGASFTEFVDCDLAGLTTYTYAVSAANGQGEGPLSDPVSAQTGPQPPAAPTGLAATLEEGPIVHLTWTPPSDTPANPVAGQTVYRVAQGEEGLYGLAYLPAGATAWDDDTATAGRAYTYHVQAHNGAGATASAALDVDIAAGLAGTAPSAPRDLAATPSGDCIHLTWSPPAWAGTGGFFGYTVHRALGDNPLGLPVATAATQFDDCGLEPLTTYRYAVSAQNRYGDSPLSDEVSSAVGPQAPYAVANLGAEADYGPIVRLWWSPPSNVPAHPIDGILVYRWEPGQGSWIQQASLAADANHWQDASVAGGQTYSYGVVTYGPDHCCTWAYIDVDVAAYLAPPDAAPLDLVAEGSTCIRLTWAAPATDEPVLDYRVYRGPAGGPLQYLSGDASGRTLLDCDLEGFATYRYAVTAVYAAGEGPLSLPVEVQAGPQPPAAPADLVATVIGGPAVFLMWSPPASTPGNPVDGLMVVRWDPVDQVWRGRATLAADADRWIDGGVAAGTSYTYGIWAFNAGDTTMGATAEAVVPATPAPPSGLVASYDAVAGAVALSWTPAAATPEAPVDGQLVLRQASGEAGWWQIGDLAAAASAFQDAAVEAGRTYTYRVVAHNLAGQAEGPAASVRVPGVPSAPLDVAATRGLLATTVSWHAPADDGGWPVYGYTLYRSVDGGAPQVAGHLGAAARQASDHCPALHECDYWLTASNHAGEGAGSQHAWVGVIPAPRL